MFYNLSAPLLILLLIISALNTQHDLILVLGHPVNQIFDENFIDRTYVVAFL
jgi:hypothetical protein